MNTGILRDMIGLGTAAIGRPSYINIKEQPSKGISASQFRSDGVSMISKAYELGIRYFDTAPGYGIAEDILIDWLDQYQVESVEIASKWGYTYVADFDPNAKIHEIKEHSLSKLNEQWAKSRHMLPDLSTYQIHSATFESGVLDDEYILYRLLELKEEFNIQIGITTTGPNQVEVLKAAMDIDVENKQLFSVYQVTYNVFDQSLAEVTSYFKNEDNRLIIKEALANGRVFPNLNYKHYTSSYTLLKKTAEKHNVGIDAIALRYCIDTVPVYKVLSGANNEAHLISNLKTNQIKLDSSDIALLMELSVDPKFYWNERKNLKWN